MKIWNKLKLKPQLAERNKKKFLTKRGINEETLNSDLKYLVECKFLLPIWHSEKEIIEWVRKEQLEGRMKIETFFNKQIKEVVKAKARLLEKELLQDINGKDHLILTFKHLERKLVLFPKKEGNRWDELAVGQKYKIYYGIQKDPSHEKDILLNFYKQKEWKAREKLIRSMKWIEVKKVKV